MGTHLRCDCGFEIQAADDDELVAAARRHALTAHGVRFTPREILALAGRGGEALDRERRNRQGS